MCAHITLPRPACVPVRAFLPLSVAVFFAVPAGAVGPPVPSAVLVDRCRELAADQQSEGARFCDSYVRGYLAGLRSAGWLTITPETPSRESFSDRAWRTRLGPRVRATVAPRICLPEGTPLQALVTQLLAYTYADAAASLADLSAPQLLENLLRSAYPCPRTPAAGQP